MTRFLKFFFFFTLAVLFTFPVFSGWMINACAQTIDEYSIGSDDHDYKDVIGDKNLFDIFSADVNLIGTTPYVDIYSNFAWRRDEKLFSGYTRAGRSIGHGDLFLSSALPESGEIALQRCETGANDLIQGKALLPVPEPATMFLFGFGLIGIAGLGRKKFKKR